MTSSTAIERSLDPSGSLNTCWTSLPKYFSCLAPMEDVTDQAFRRILLKYGRPDLFFTEFTSVSGLMSDIGRQNVIHRLSYSSEEHPIIAQIWGTDPQEYFEGTRIVKEMGFDGVDINMGCPVKKIVKQGACSALIKSPTLAIEIIKAVQEASGGELPVSVKTRMGFDRIVTESWISMLLETNIEALTLHPRLAIEMSTKSADWSQVKVAVDLRDRLSKGTVIVGNGDVTSVSHGVALCKKYGCDGYMVGRGIFNDPYLFSDNYDDQKKGVYDRIEVLIEHLELHKELWEDTKNFHKMKKFYKMYIKGFDGAVDLRDKLMRLQSIEDTISYLKSFIGKIVDN